MGKIGTNHKKTMQYAIKDKIDSEFKDTDIVRCVGCKYWQRFSAGLMCCNYLYETNRPREIMPIDCYKHEGTPYTPKTKKVSKFNKPVFLNKQLKEGKKNE